MNKKVTTILSSLLLLVLLASCSADAKIADPIAHAKENLNIPIYTPNYLPAGFTLNEGSSYFVDNSLFLSYQSEDGKASLEIYQDVKAGRDVNKHIYKYVNNDYTEEDGIDPEFYKEIGNFVGKFKENKKFKVLHYQFIPKEFMENETEAHYVIKSKGISEDQFKQIISTLSE